MGRGGGRVVYRKECGGFDLRSIYLDWERRGGEPSRRLYGTDIDGGGAKRKPKCLGAQVSKTLAALCMPDAQFFAAMVVGLTKQERDRGKSETCVFTKESRFFALVDYFIFPASLPPPPLPGTPAFWLVFLFFRIYSSGEVGLFIFFFA